MNYIKRYLILLLIINVTLHAEEYAISNSFFLSQHTGKTTYEIGGFIQSDTEQSIAHFPLSKLEFPKKAIFLNTELTFPISKITTLKILGGQSLDASKQTMKDFDWLNINQKSPDIYSESTAAYKSFYINPELTYTPFGSRVSFGIGCLIQHEKWLCKDTKQWSPTNPDMPEKYAGGETLRYTLNQTIPYIAMSAKHTLKKLDIQLKWQAAPVVYATDTDDHVLRSKKSRANSTGYGQWFSAKICYPIAPHWHLFLEGTLGSYATHGKQRQTRYSSTSEGPPGYLATLDYQHKKEDSTLSFGITHELSENRHHITLNTPPSHPQPYAITSGINYVAPNSLFEQGIGASLTIQKNNLYGQVDILKTNTKAHQLSSGTYTRIPLLIGLQRPISSTGLVFNYGCGYAFNSHTPHPSVKSHLAKLGYLNAEESASSNPFLFFGLSYSPKKSSSTYSVRYAYEPITLKTKDSIRKNQSKQTLHTISFSAAFKLFPAKPQLKIPNLR